MNALLAEPALIIQELDQIVLVPLLAQEVHALGDVQLVAILLVVLLALVLLLIQEEE
jgi:hypothetical protein